MDNKWTLQYLPIYYEFFEIIIHNLENSNYIGCIVIRKSTLKDDNKLLDFIKNIYYVLLTRGIKGTYIYVCDDNYRNYLSKYIDVVN